MSTIFESPDDILATAVRLLEAEGMQQSALLLRSAQARFEQTGYDNWNGGTNIYTLYLRIVPEDYARLGSGRETFEQQIAERLKPIIEQYSADWFGVKIVPLVQKDMTWRHSRGGVSHATRSNIFDLFRIGGVVWSGILGEVEFLERIFDLRTIPSRDRRFTDAAGDIWQHRVNNPDDWSDDWVFVDRRFDLFNGPDEVFLRFLCETVHPVVRPDRAQAALLVRQFNDHLKGDGWELVEEELLAGRARYVARPRSSAAVRATTRARTVADALDSAWMHKEILRLERAIETDPSLARIIHAI